MPEPSNEDELAEEFEGDEWTRQIFEHYGCDSAVGDYEILVYAMLLEHKPNLISLDQRKRAGRPQFWTDDKDIWLYEIVEEYRRDLSIPSEVRAFPSKVLRRIHDKRWFVQELGRNLSVGTLGNAYARGRKAAIARKIEPKLS